MSLNECHRRRRLCRGSTRHDGEMMNDDNECIALTRARVLHGSNIQETWAWTWCQTWTPCHINGCLEMAVAP